MLEVCYFHVNFSMNGHITGLITIRGREYEESFKGQSIIPSIEVKAYLCSLHNVVYNMNIV